VALQDGKLVAGKARHGVGLSHTATQSCRDLHQKLVAERVSEAVVDLFEAVEVEAKNGEPLAADLREAIFDSRAEQMPIGQIGQSVVERHVRDSGFGPSSLRDVFMRGNPAAAEHGLVGDEYVAPF